MATLTGTRQQAADLIGYSVRTFDSTIRDRLPDSARTGRGTKLRYDLAAVVTAFVAYRLEQERPTVASDDPDAALFAGPGDSPHLERMRKFRADLYERDVKERDRVLVRRQTVFDALRSGISVMAAAGEALTRRFGNEAAEIFNDAVTDFGATIKRAMVQVTGDSTDGGDGTANR